MIVLVSAVWWGDRGMSMVGTDHPWRFSVHREDGGWRITKVEPYAWCGGHVRADACGRWQGMSRSSDCRQARQLRPDFV